MDEGRVGVGERGRPGDAEAHREQTDDRADHDEAGRVDETARPDAGAAVVEQDLVLQRDEDDRGGAERHDRDPLAVVRAERGAPDDDEHTGADRSERRAAAECELVGDGGRGPHDHDGEEDRTVGGADGRGVGAHHVPARRDLVEDRARPAHAGEQEHGVHAERQGGDHALQHRAPTAGHGRRARRDGRGPPRRRVDTTYRSVAKTRANASATVTLTAMSATTAGSSRGSSAGPRPAAGAGGRAADRGGGAGGVIVPVILRGAASRGGRARGSRRRGTGSPWRRPQ